MTNPWPDTERRDDPARGRQKRRSLTAKQVTDLLALLDNPEAVVRWRADMRLLFRLGLFAGLREKDAALLRWADVDMSRRVIRYTPHKTRGKSITAEVPMVPEVAGEILARWNAREPDQDHVLPEIAAEYSNGNKAVEEEAVRLVHKITGDGNRERRDGDPQRLRVRSPYGFHSTRHTFCSVLAQRGVPLAKLAAMTGDGPSTLQAYYVHVEGEMHELAGAFAPLLTNGNGTSTEAPRDRLRRMVDTITDAQVNKVLRMVEPRTGKSAAAAGNRLPASRST